MLHGDYAYVRVGGGQYRILNVSDPTSPTLVTETDVPLTGVVSTCGNYLYASNFDRRDITVVDISDPTNPIRIGSAPYDWSGRSRIDMKVSGDYLYFLTWYYYNDNDLDPRVVLDILDISDPISPIKVGSYETTDYPAENLVASNNYVYISVSGDGLHILDVSNPKTPTEVDVYALDTEDILVDGNRLYALTWSYGSEGNQLHILDVLDPLHITELGSCEQPLGPPNWYNTFDWMVEGDHVYVSLDDRLTILDVSNPENPAQTYWGRPVKVDYPNEAYIQGLEARGDYAYLTYGRGDKEGLFTFDVSDSQSPALVNEYRVLDYYGPVAVNGDYAYVATSEEGVWVLRVVDVSNPRQPTDIGFKIALDGRVYDIAVNGEVLYLAAGKAGLSIWDVSDPVKPTKIDLYPMPRTLYKLAFRNSYLYGTDGELFILDINDPANPTEINSINTPGTAMGVSVDGDYAYVANGDGLEIIDVSDMNNLKKVGFSETYYVAYDVDVRGDFAFVADHYWGLAIMDISDRTSPTRYDRYSISGSADHITVDDSYIYVDSDLGGMLILRFAPYKVYLPLTIRQSS